MEVCGSHTHAIAKYALAQEFAPELKFVSGPGCPVCVTDLSDIDNCVKLSKLQGTILATFGDLLRIPNSKGETLQGSANVKVVYSAFDSLKLALETPSKNVVFLACGFETTAPLVAALVKEAARRGIKNFYVYSMLKSVMPVLKNLLNDKTVKIDGLILPGHVAAVTGQAAFNFIKIPAVVAGFLESELRNAVETLLKLCESKKALIKNCYADIVSQKPNAKAINVINEVFTLQSVPWRAFGNIAKSGFKLNKKFAKFDAAKKFNLKNKKSYTTGCLCKEILKGKKQPPACARFGVKCTPLAPIGPCMVSSEGACAAYYKYGNAK
jgi:hydrogenase expression/formation protein HypD